MLPVLNYVGVFLSDGLMYSLLAMGFYVSYSTLDFPDLSVEGTVLTGGLVYSALCGVIGAWPALLAAFLAGALAGALTGVLHVKLHIRPLLCGILVSTGLISVNLVTAALINGGDFTAMGSTQVMLTNAKTMLSTAPATLLPKIVGGFYLRKLVVFLIVAVIFKILLDLFFRTKCGLLLRAAGNSEDFVSALGQNPGNSKILGLAIGNGYAATAGALIVQSRGSVTQDMGLGMIVIGLASVIIGTTIFQRARALRPTTQVIIGSVLYQACLTVASAVGVPSAYNKLLMALLFTAALVFSARRSDKSRKKVSA